MRNRAEHATHPHGVGLFLKGMAMGAADLIPGVSGGTIALITGIYDELIQSISNLHPRLLVQLKQNGWKQFWNEANGSFFLLLLSGIATSVLAFSSLLHFLLEEHRTFLFSFFFGLVAFSVPMIAREVKEWNLKTIGIGILGTVIAFGIGSLPAMTVDPGLGYLVLCGSVAACAMILPGISGSFILLLLGVYPHVIGALKSFDVVRIAAVGIGAVVGLLLFSRVLKLALERHHSVILSLLAGFLLGSLQSLWPWKEPLTLLYTHSDGRETWSMINALPPAGDLALIIACVGFCVAGGLLVHGLQRWSQGKKHPVR